LGAIAVLAIGSCTLDLSLKHRCETSADCASDRVCIRNVCESAVPGPNYMFVTSQKFPPRFKPLDDADRKCNDAAMAGGLPGRFHAWLSTAEVFARDRLTGARGWVRQDGSPFADTIDDLVAGRIFNPPLLDEFGHEVRSGDTDFVATGTDAMGFNSPGNTCNEWANDQAVSFLYGTTEGTTAAWTAFGTNNCGAPTRIYCFGVDQNFPVAPAETPGKRAFVLDGTFVPVGGRDAADMACSKEATAAGLTGEFWALLPKGDEWAAFRFPDPEARWVRLDGVPINAVGSDPLAGDALASPLNVTSKNRYLGGQDQFVFTGATSPLDFSTDSCKDWTDTSINAEVGLLGVANSAWFAYNVGSCSSPPTHVYCLEH
jgi:hypothetical protein